MQENAFGVQVPRSPWGMLMRSLGKWFRTWWLTVPEPREQSVAWGVVYVTLTFTGLVTIVRPPTTIPVVLGSEAMLMFALMLLVGVLFATIGGWMEFWKLERLGIILMASGLALYGSVVLTLHFQSDGSGLTQFGIVVALVGALAGRYLMIWRYDFRPRAELTTGG